MRSRGGGGVMLSKPQSEDGEYLRIYEKRENLANEQACHPMTASII